MCYQISLCLMCGRKGSRPCRGVFYKGSCKRYTRLVCIAYGMCRTRIRNSGYYIRIDIIPSCQKLTAIISHLQSCVREHLWTERDSRALNELLCYEQKQNGSFGAIVGKHDDILMTRAIGLWVALREMELPRIVKNETKKVVAARKVVSAATL